jgi:hypothetical protein
MFYGTDFGVGAYIYKTVIPVTLGNIVGGAFFVGCAFWFLYGRDDTAAAQTGQTKSGHKRGEHTGVTGNGGTLDARESRNGILIWNRRRHEDASERA